MSKKPLTELQAEALRLMNEEGTNGRHMARIIGIYHQHYSNIKTGVKPITRTMARRIVKAFNQFSRCVTPRVQDGDGD